MSENLKTNHYSDGTSVHVIYPNNNINNSSSYGYLYTLSDAIRGTLSNNTDSSGVQGVCPVGWHVPSKNEWEELKQYTCNNGYVYPVNSAGFYYGNYFFWFGSSFKVWTSTMGLNVDYDGGCFSGENYYSNDINTAVSVRCLRD